jgi:hypothetical protein
VLNRKFGKLFDVHAGLVCSSHLIADLIGDGFLSDWPASADKLDGGFDVVDGLGGDHVRCWLRAQPTRSAGDGEKNRRIRENIFSGRRNR